MNVNLTITDFFIIIFRALYGCGRLDRLIINKAHLILIATYYRQNLKLLRILRRIEYFVLCLIAILFLVERERALKKSLYFIQIEKLRVSSDRVNLQYYIQFLSLNRFEKSFYMTREKLLLRAALEIYRDNIQRWIYKIEIARSIVRSIYYIREKFLSARLAKRLYIDFYYSEFNLFERNRI